MESRRIELRPCYYYKKMRYKLMANNALPLCKLSRSPTLTLTDSTDQLATAYSIYLVLLLRGICYRHFLTGKISFHSFAIEFLLINLQLNLTYHASALFRFTLSCLHSVYESVLSERVLMTLLCQYCAKFLPAVLTTTLNI